MAYDLSEINLKTVADPKGFVEESDEVYRKKVEKAAELIIENRKKSPIVLLAGPSGSGKTTTSMKIAEELDRRSADMSPRFLLSPRRMICNSSFCLLPCSSLLIFLVNKKML